MMERAVCNNIVSKKTGKEKITPPAAARSQKKLASSHLRYDRLHGCSLKALQRQHNVVQADRSVEQRPRGHAFRVGNELEGQCRRRVKNLGTTGGKGSKIAKKNK